MNKSAFHSPVVSNSIQNSAYNLFPVFQNLHEKDATLFLTWPILRQFNTYLWDAATSGLPFKILSRKGVLQMHINLVLAIIIISIIIIIIIIIYSSFAPHGE
jgi:hypothetical protein